MKKRKAQAQAKSKEEERHIELIILPFLPGITERIKRLLKNHQIKMVTKPLHTVGNMLPSLKDKIKKFDQHGVVYKIMPVQMFILVKLVDHLKHDAKTIKPDVIVKRKNEDLKKKSALV